MNHGEQHRPYPRRDRSRRRRICDEAVGPRNAGRKIAARRRGLTLTMTRQIPAIPDPASATEVASARSVRVMLVDDSLVVRSILERIVEQRPELTICAPLASAREAIAYLACEPVDVVRRSAEHTSELQSLISISYAVLCLK